MSDKPSYLAARVGWTTASFRTKIIVVALAIVMISLVMSSAVALRNVTTLGGKASDKIANGLSAANREYLENYIETTALRTNLMMERSFSELEMLGEMMQLLIDRPDEEDRLGDCVSTLPYFHNKLTYNAQSDWQQNSAGDPVVVSVWGHLLENGRLKPGVARHLKNTAVLDLVLPAMHKHGSKKLYMYTVGPPTKSYLRLSPYKDMASMFDRKYPGHNKKDFWEFFFAGLVESWQKWPDAGMKKEEYAGRITITAPYDDAAGGGIIVSAFHPVWDHQHKQLAGAAAMDFSLGQIVDLIKDVKIAQTGFAFFAQSQGTVLAVHERGEKILGVTSQTTGSAGGVNLLARNLRESTQPEIKSLQLPRDDRTHIQRINLLRKGTSQGFIVVTKRMDPIPTFMEAKREIKQEYWTLGFVVPEQEVFQTLYSTQKDLKETVRRTLFSQLWVALGSLLVVLLGVLWVSKQMTAGLTALASAARRLTKKEYDVRVDIKAHDEIGQLGAAFNGMAGEIERYTLNLENLVKERTQELEKANDEIVALNMRLRDENIRLGAEIEVAQRIQLMVLPKKEELTAIHDLEIAGYLRPADDVAGDYYDVLRAGDLVKIGIGDVTGHGLSSGVLMLMVQSITRTLLDAGEYDPVRFLSLLNQVLYKNIKRIDSDRNLTLSFVDYKDHKLTLYGQHEEVILVRNDGTLERINTIDLGFPVGLEPDIKRFISTRTFPLEKGDVVTLFTDGVTEAEDPARRQFSIERLCESVAARHRESAEDIIRGVLADVMAHIGTQKVYDDITLVVIKGV